VTTTLPLAEGPAFDAFRVKVSSVCELGVRVAADFVSVTAAKNACTVTPDAPDVTGVVDPGGVPEAVAESRTEPLLRSAWVTV
jgi:hypothetical protein